MKLIKNKKGVILAEAIISIAILMTATVVLGGIIHNAISSISISKNYLLAQNLINEAQANVEILIRTNQMLRPQEVYPDAENCWIFTDPAILITNQLETNCLTKIKSNSEYTFQNNNGMPKLSIMQAGEDNDILYIDNGRYTHTASDNAKKSNITRSINFTETSNKYVKYTITVSWSNGAKTDSLSREFTTNKT